MKNKFLIGIFSSLSCFCLSSCFLVIKEKDFSFDNYVITLDNSFYQYTPQENIEQKEIIYKFGSESAGISILTNTKNKEYNLNDELQQIKEKEEVYPINNQESIEILTKDDINYFTFLSLQDVNLEYIHFISVKTFDHEGKKYSLVYEAYTYYDNEYKEVYDVNFYNWYKSITLNIN